MRVPSECEGTCGRADGTGRRAAREQKYIAPQRGTPPYPTPSPYVKLEAICDSRDDESKGFTSASPSPPSPMFRFLAVAALVAAASAFAPPLSVRPTSAVRSSSIVMDEKAAKAKKEKPPRAEGAGRGRPLRRGRAGVQRGEQGRRLRVPAARHQRRDGHRHVPKRDRDRRRAVAFDVPHPECAWHLLARVRPLAAMQPCPPPFPLPTLLADRWTFRSAHACTNRASKPEAVKGLRRLPPKPGGDKAGWKNYGENRVIGKTHDNSV